MTFGWWRLYSGAPSVFCCSLQGKFAHIHTSEHTVASVFATDYVIVRVLLTLSFFLTQHIMIFLTVVQ